MKAILVMDLADALEWVKRAIRNGQETVAIEMLEALQKQVSAYYEDSTEDHERPWEGHLSGVAYKRKL